LDEVGSDELCEEAGYDIGEEYDSFGYGWTHEVEGCGEDDYVENIVDKTCSLLESPIQQ
jgi:hypothetical protein